MSSQPSPIASQDSSISHHLRAVKKSLQDVAFGAKYVWSSKTRAGKLRFEFAESQCPQLDILEQDTFEILHLIRFCKNMVAPVNKIPSEILALVPDFLGPEDRDQGLIALTHVCRAWREVFISRPSLWADFDCKDGEKTQVYLERSKSSPINLSLDITEVIFPHNYFFRIIPQAIGRLKSLSVEGPLRNVRVVIDHLSYPAPLLEHLMIYNVCDELDDDDLPLPSALFNGDLSSLCTLHLNSVCTELPWRNMVNLTSFTLAYMEVSVGRLLDFFEGAPHLRKINLHFAIPMTGAQSRRLVSLVCLKSMYIGGDRPSSVLLDHLLIPVGAKLEIRLHQLSSIIREHLPRSLDNLKNFSNFTAIRLYFGENCPYVKFSGPNGEVTVTSNTFLIDRTDWVFGNLAQLDTSKTERLEIDCGAPPSGDYLRQALIPMTGLRTLILSKCVKPHIVIHALHPATSPSEITLCPKLEELVLVLRDEGEEFDITSVTEMAAARASREGRFRTIRIIDGQGEGDLDVSELRKHVWNVEYSTRLVQSTANRDED